MDGALAGRSVVVTGATSGIGLAAAEALVQRGVNVIGVGRDGERCLHAEERLRALSPEAAVAYQVADLSVQAQVRDLAERIRVTLAAWGMTGLDGLANVAGVFVYWQTLTPDGFEMQWAVNHLAPFVLTRELLPLLQRAPWARVVTVSSGSHYHTRLQWDDIQLRRRYHPLRAYKQTKLANVLFTAELNRRLGPGSTVRALAADPGLVSTEIGFKANPGLARCIWTLRRWQAVPPEQAAHGIVFLLAEPSLPDGDAIYWKDGRPKAPDPEALNVHAARRLWELSEMMTTGTLVPHVEGAP